MSLLLNEDFAVYQLRLAYLQHIHDGVGERLINLNTSVLNNPAFRAAGWTPDSGAVRRCYSPPIPTTGAGVSSEYFQAPRKPTRVSLEDDGDGIQGGMVTGNQGSEDTIGAGGIGANELRKRRRRREQMEEEDSSDLSDDSDDDDHSAAHGIKFNKMPIRNRGASDASPEDTFKSEREQPALNVISPSVPPDAVGQGLRRGSLGQVEAVKQRARRDTTTSSDMSSDNELDPNAFNRRMPGRPGGKKVVLSERIQEEDQRDVDGEGEDSDLDDEDVGEASDISDEFEVEDSAGISHTPNMLGIGVGGASEDTSPLKPPPNMPPAVTPHNTSPKKPSSKDSLPKLPKLPPGRPISTIVPPSLITMGLKGSGGSDEQPFQRFADLSGKGDPSPLWIKIYAPFSDKSTTAIEVPIRKAKENNPVTVVELIGLALWRYNEEKFKPEINEADQNVNRWTLRIVEDEEVDFDFPALGRTRPVTDFTSNNNRPPQRRARDKPWDEFGLVKATDDQFKENQELTPQFNDLNTAATTSAAKELPQQATLRPAPAERSESTMTTQSTAASGKSFNPSRNPITGSTFAVAATAAAQRKDTGPLLDAPQQSAAQSTPRTGASRTITVHFTDPHSFSQSNLNIPTTSDTYIAEIFDHACKRLNLDKALYVLKVHGTQTVAPSDRTVEALAENLSLDLVRRRFIGAGAGDGMFGLGLSGSPGSSSPNAPLELVPTIGSVGAQGQAGGGGAGGGKRRKGFALHNRPEPSSNHLPLDVGGKRYNVLRKQPLSFAPSHPRTLIITPEYLQILPAAPDSLAAPTGKVTNVPMTSIIGVKVSRKHPKMVRVLVYREKETKRYDFECARPGEAEGVCADIRKGLEGARDGFVGGY